ncbi:hypothetical protein, variant 1 [Aphanomyces invadans]|uniref:PWWP domain-containing protein n=2 Tax=Aphanomyces invadans TaxID=157072 RepID=A0A024UFI4_9STRA|nr:hypothetical protein, variant 1 [Aphanomyces invadans]ETW04935.1 hypothetical protein, variant 1 [Aphanomyces invadans]|eukprot:XP_008866373.1 hypothetical protein, variant 1 [Aphanomyces invadans]
MPKKPFSVSWMQAAMADDGSIPYNCVAWTLIEGYPWSPVYVLDPNQVRENLEMLGNSHQDHLKKAREWPNVYRLVYNFGYHNISLQRLGQFIKPWNCHEHHRFLKGYPLESMSGRFVVQAFQEALYEAQTFLQTDERYRLLPNMTASDFYPSCNKPAPTVMAPIQALSSLPSVLQGNQDAYSHSPRNLCGSHVESSTGQSDSLGHILDSVQRKGTQQQLKAPSMRYHASPTPQMRSEEQPAAPSRRTRAMIQLEQGTHQMEKSRQPQIAQESQRLSHLTLLHQAASLRQSPARKSSSRLAAKESHQPKDNTPPKEVDSRTIQKSKRSKPAKTAAKKLRIAKTRKPPSRARIKDAQSSPVVPVPLIPTVVKTAAANVETTVSYSSPPRTLGELLHPTTQSKPQHQTEDIRMGHPVARVDLNLARMGYAIDGVKMLGNPNSSKASLPVQFEPDIRLCDHKFNSIVWAYIHGMSWWPAIVLDPFQVRSALNYLGNSHGLPLKRCKKDPNDCRLVYVFGLYVFWALKSKIRPWRCFDHETFLHGAVALFDTNAPMVDMFAEGVREAEAYLGAQVLDQVLPYIDSSEISSAAVMLPPAEVQCNTVAWARREGDWWPVFICDPRTLRLNLYHLGIGVLQQLRVARGLPFHNRIVYYFGSHEFGLYKDDSMIKRWLCSQHTEFSKAPSKSPDGISLADAVKEVQEFFVSDEGSRVLLCKFIDRGATLPQLHSFTEGAKIPEYDGLRIVFGLYQPSSIRAKRGEEGDNAPVQRSEIVPTPSSSSAVGCGNTISPMKTVLPTVLMQHGLYPILLPLPLERISMQPTEDHQLHENAMADVLTELVDTNCMANSTIEMGETKGDTIESPEAIQEATEAITPEQNVPDFNYDMLALEENSEVELSIIYTVEDLVATVEIQCTDESSQWNANDTDETSNVVDGEYDLNRVAWARKSSKHPWWPVFVCDPRTFRSELHFLGIRHRRLLYRARRDIASKRLVYYFGRHTFGVTSLPFLKRWNSSSHTNYATGLNPNGAAVDIFLEALHEAQCHDLNGARCDLPFVMPWDVDLSRVPPTPPQDAVKYASVVWAQESGSWWPVYTCDPDMFRPELQLGPEDARLLRIAVQLPQYYILVYFFGKHQFGLRQRLALTNGWLCCNHRSYMDQCLENEGSVSEQALSEAEEFVSKHEPHKLPFQLHLVPSVKTSASPRQLKLMGKVPVARTSHLDSFWLAEWREETKVARHEAELKAHRKDVYSFFKKMMRLDNNDSDSSLSSSSGVSVRSVDDSDEPESCDTEWEHSDPESSRRTYSKELKLGGKAKSPGRHTTPEPPALSSIVRTRVVSTPRNPIYRRLSCNGGIQRTAHIWKHFIWLEHLGRYHNNKYIECRFCRQAYENRGNRDIAPPKVLVSQVSKMKQHLLKCPHCNFSHEDLESPNDAKRAIEMTSTVEKLSQRSRRSLRSTAAEVGSDTHGTAEVPQQKVDDDKRVQVKDSIPQVEASTEPVANKEPDITPVKASGTIHNDDNSEFDHEIQVPTWPALATSTAPVKKPKVESQVLKKRKSQKFIVLDGDSDTMSDENFKSLRMVAKVCSVKKRRKTAELPATSERPTTRNGLILPPLVGHPFIRPKEKDRTEPIEPIVAVQPTLPMPKNVQPEPITPPVAVAPSHPTVERELLLQRRVFPQHLAIVAPPVLPTPSAKGLTDWHDTIVWAYVKGFPWVPAYVLNPFKLRTDLHLLGKDHAPTLKNAKQKPRDNLIIYYFGTHNFGLITKPSIALRPWHCDERSKFLKGFPKASCRSKAKEELVDAIEEAKCFEAADKSTRLLPYMVPSDTDPSRSPPQVQPVAVDSLAWAISQGYPWMPVYVCDPYKLRSNLHFLGNDHYDDLMEARLSPNSRLVYYFGSHCFCLYKMNGSLKPWDCPEQNLFRKGQSESILYIKPSILAEFNEAMKEVEEFLSMDVENRVLPEMHSSDMNPLLPSPQSQNSENWDVGSDASIPDSEATVSDGESRQVDLQTNSHKMTKAVISVRTRQPKTQGNSSVAQQETRTKDKATPRRPHKSPPLYKPRNAPTTYPITTPANNVIVIDSSNESEDASNMSVSSAKEEEELSQRESSGSDSDEGCYAARRHSTCQIGK